VLSRRAFFRPGIDGFPPTGAGTMYFQHQEELRPRFAFSFTKKGKAKPPERDCRSVSSSSPASMTESPSCTLTMVFDSRFSTADESMFDVVVSANELIC
jgi:hypothetical protein